MGLRRNEPGKGQLRHVLLLHGKGSPAAVSSPDLVRCILWCGGVRWAAPEKSPDAGNSCSTAGRTNI